MDIEDNYYTIKNDFPQTIEFKVQHTAVSVDLSPNVVSSLSPLRLEPVNIHEEALLQTIRDQAKKSRPSKDHNLIQSIYRSDPPACSNLDPPACTNQPSKDTFKEKMTASTEQTVDISSKEIDMEPTTKTLEDKLVEANAKLDAVQIMLEISKLEAESEAMAKAAGIAIQKAKHALEKANEEADIDITQQGADGNNKELKNINRAITECIEKTIQNAENQFTNETIEERADDSVQETFANIEDQREGISVIDVGATTNKDFDCSSAPLLNDKDFESLPVPVPDTPENGPDSPVLQIDTREEMLTSNESADPHTTVFHSSAVSQNSVGSGFVKITNRVFSPRRDNPPPVHDMKEDMSFSINLVDPPSIIRQGSIPSPTPDEDVTCVDPSSFCTPLKSDAVVGSKDSEGEEGEDESKSKVKPVAVVAAAESWWLKKKREIAAEEEMKMLVKEAEEKTAAALKKKEEIVAKDKEMKVLVKKDEEKAAAALKKKEEIAAKEEEMNMLVKKAEEKAATALKAALKKKEEIVAKDEEMKVLVKKNEEKAAAALKKKEEIAAKEEEMNMLVKKAQEIAATALNAALKKKEEIVAKEEEMKVLVKKDEEKAAAALKKKEEIAAKEEEMNMLVKKAEEKAAAALKKREEIAAEEEEMKMLVKKAEEKHKLKEELQHEATERKRREEFAKKKADMKAILEAEEEEIRLLEERAKEKLELKARLQQEEEEENNRMRLQSLKMAEQQAEEEEAARRKAVSAALAATAAIVAAEKREEEQEEEEAARRKQEEEEAKSKRYVSPCLLAARELSEQDTNNDVDTTTDSNNNKLRWMILQSKIKECRTKLMDPESSIEEQGVAAELMTKYALSAKALKKSIIS